MRFGIEIRNVDTGLAVTLDNAQAVADFLAAHPGETWEGYKCLGELPAPTPAVDPILPSLSEAMTALEASVGDSAVGEVAFTAENPLGLQSVADAQAAGVMSVVDAAPAIQGSSDTYLPVDQGAQS